MKGKDKKKKEIYVELETVYLEAYSEPSRTSTMDLFSKLVNDCKPLSIFFKRLYRWCWLGCKYTSAANQILFYEMSVSFKNQYNNS